MVQTAELLLDGASEQAVLEQWRRLEEADLPNQGRHTGATNRPHLTLVVAEEMPASLDPLLAAAAAALPVAARLGPLVVLGGRRHVLARLVVPSAALLDLHAGALVVTAACPGRNELVEAGTWTPHVTLARGLSADQVSAALAVLGGQATDAGQVVGLRRFDGEARRTRLVAGADPQA
ncbi:2'-5' RNA ligase family protein [Pseudokineococcus sp. 1T1Z-3]|uniref:2'-5' RNA ligase family protein n=1 Tax=Pseudokineococcus sp. 1T1Z-3 TaxID=3132745 RepID=UPI0030AF82A1